MVRPLHSGWAHTILGLGNGHVATAGKGGLAGIGFLYGVNFKMGASLLRGLCGIEATVGWRIGRDW